MNETSRQENSFGGTAWGELAHLCRRVCVLRATGQAAAAASLHSGELHDALEKIEPASANRESRFDVLFKREEERVLNASLTAELLAPMLEERLRLGGAIAVRPVPASTPAAAPKPPRATAPTIADFIDDMLDQERAGPRRVAPLRRAS